MKMWTEQPNKITGLFCYGKTRLSFVNVENSELRMVC